MGVAGCQGASRRVRSRSRSDELFLPLKGLIMSLIFFNVPSSFCPKVLHFDRGSSSPDEDDSFESQVVRDDGFDEEIDHPGKLHI